MTLLRKPYGLMFGHALHASARRRFMEREHHKPSAAGQEPLIALLIPDWSFP